ncbi:MAG: DNA replication and repair protein RecF [Paludibacteraceae bacterium]|nr:DNA replication and repair protein RecF [Paludibacteraceae bacterium]
MTLKELHLLNYKNIPEAHLHFADRLNGLVGLNGQGKTNVLDAIYLLSFAKSAFSLQDRDCIRHGEQMAMVQGVYDKDGETVTITCGLRQGGKKQFRRGDKPYQRLSDHIGLLPLVLISPQDIGIVLDGSDVRRKFMDGTIAQYDPTYLPALNNYSQLVQQRNALLKQLADKDGNADNSSYGEMLSVYEQQMLPPAQQIYEARRLFIDHFVPFFADTYAILSDGNEVVRLTYQSQLAERQLPDAWEQTRQRDIILGWTSVGCHKDDLLFSIGDYAIKQVASQGQIKTCLLALRLAQALFLSDRIKQPPILLLDDIFDRLDSRRVKQLVEMVTSERIELPAAQVCLEKPFSQIFLTDTDRHHIHRQDTSFAAMKTFVVSDGTINEDNE